ncbi:hypothetical protein BWI97_11360 [Siphonobacter sp. BAB-5405]|uniref:DUF1800 domain-containing protein n=1 Tax=Siphonobacter sp. BAB-5405 TaxID=1864825 RepID=UPI000C7F7AC3|nr:DUF1800 domain-containing protein [Siphonobacter sp. BAB-5405]PMD96758.1 hypothetical protein BWI97_11360 [Siphonobacter sp. BAB-5405]
MKNTLIQLKHLYQRAGFGASPATLQQASRHSVRRAVQDLFKDAQTPLPLHVVDPQRVGYSRKALLEMVLQKDPLSEEQKKQYIRQIDQGNRELIGDLNYAWVTQMASGTSVFREKMTLFWHGHFACRSLNPAFVQRQNNTIRQHALGKFGDLLQAIAQDPAMLQFLNNQQNRKQSPNENFAREVMELFTLGRGHYSEQDIKEAARTFTGWGFNREGTFEIRKNQHDAGTKTIFGKTGPFDGTDTLSLILERPETAPFLVTKIYRYFVNDRPDPEIIQPLAAGFRKKDYDISWLMHEILTSDWFYRPENIGVNIKSPVELLVGFQRQLGLNFGQKQAVLYVQKALDQVLFYPPNVAGWPGGATWIDSSSLLLRMKLPEIILQAAQLNFKAKADGDVNTDYLAKRSNKPFLQTQFDWEAFAQPFASLSTEALLDALSTYLLARPLLPSQRDLLLKHRKNNDLQDFTLGLLTLPEYQLC